MLTFHSDSAVPEVNGGATPKVAKTPNGSAMKRKRSKKDHNIAVDDEFDNPDLDMSTSPEAPKSSTREKRKSNGTEAGSSKSSKKSKTAKAGTIPSPVKSKKKATPREPSPPPKLAKNMACIRCREKKIKCNEAKPQCNQCKRGLWTCQYEIVGPKQRSRKCTEEKPYCAYRLKVDDECGYADYP